MVAVKIGPGGVKFDKGNITDIPKLYKPPPTGLVPSAIPGLYIPPDKPIDPRDCVHYPDSPWCGGNPIDKKPLGADITPSLDNCSVSLQAKITVGFVKMPPVNVSYIYPGQCRKDYDDQSKPKPPDYVPKPVDVPSAPKNSNFSGAYDNGMSVIMILAEDTFVVGGLGNSSHFTVTGYQRERYPCDGESYQLSGRNWDSILRFNASFSSLLQTDPYTSDGSTTVTPSGVVHYTFCKGHTPAYNTRPNSDGRIPWYNNSNINYFDDIPSCTLFAHFGGDLYNGGVIVIEANYGDCKKAFTRGKYAELGPFEYTSADGTVDKIYHDYTWSEYRILDIIPLGSFYPWNPPPPDPPPPDCCMSCCSPSPNQQNNDDSLLREILERVQKIEQSAGSDNYPIKATSPIDQSSLSFADEKSAWEWLFNNFPTGGGANLGKFPFVPDIFDTDVSQRDAQGDNKTSVKTVSDALQLLIKQQQLQSKVLGLDQFPAKVPEWMIVGKVNGQDLNNDQKEYKSIAELLEWYFKNIFGIIGQLGIDFELTDTQPGQPNADGSPGEPKTTTTTVHLPNIAEAIAELFGLITHVNLTVESMQNAGLRTMLDVGSAKQQTFSTHMYVEAICDYLGFSHEDITQKLAIGFKPGETDLTKLLVETEVDVQGIKYDQKHRFRDNLHDLLKAAAIINAVHYRKFDSNGDIASLLFNHIKDRAQASKTIADPVDSQGKTDIERYYKEFEIGFEDEAGIDDHTQPYGRPYSQRPLVQKLTENQPPQAPPTPQGGQ